MGKAGNMGSMVDWESGLLPTLILDGSVYDGGQHPGEDRQAFEMYTSPVRGLVFLFGSAQNIKRNFIEIGENSRRSLKNERCTGVDRDEKEDEIGENSRCENTCKIKRDGGIYVFLLRKSDAAGHEQTTRYLDVIQTLYHGYRGNMQLSGCGSDVGAH